MKCCRTFQYDCKIDINKVTQYGVISVAVSETLNIFAIEFAQTRIEHCSRWKLIREFLHLSLLLVLPMTFDILLSNGGKDTKKSMYNIKLIYAKFGWMYV